MPGADLTFDVALGREVEFFRRVIDQDPATAVFQCVVIAQGSGTWTIEDDAVLKEYETLGDLLTGNLEVTNTGPTSVDGYERKILDYLDLTDYTIDHARGRIVPALPLLTWTDVDAGDTWAKMIVCYDDGLGTDDYGLVPVTAHALYYQGAHIVPNGTAITVNLTAGFVQAQ